MANSELEQAIVDAATAPKKIEGDQGSVEQHSLKDLVEADSHLTSKAALKNKTGFRLGKFKGPGAIG